LNAETPRKEGGKNAFVVLFLLGVSAFITVFFKRRRMHWDMASLANAAMATVIFGVIGIFLTLFGYKVFDWILPKIDVQKELGENRNIAVAIVAAAVIVSIGIVVSAAISG
jgi:putative membrane protein